MVKILRNIVFCFTCFWMGAAYGTEDVKCVLIGEVTSITDDSVNVQFHSVFGDVSCDFETISKFNTPEVPSFVVDILNTGSVGETVTVELIIKDGVATMERRGGRDKTFSL